jgi:Response regulator containing CheY-like receiver, AAA-type ATPase, and DNA-binding domains
MISILYVDDEPALATVAAHYLSRTMETMVDTASSVTAALALLENHRYDAIVSDYSLPDSDGISFIEAIRARGDPDPPSSCSPGGGGRRW